MLLSLVLAQFLRDNSSLTVREPGLVDGRQPLRVVLDSQLQTPVDANVVSGPGQCLIVTTARGMHTRRQSLNKRVLKYWWSNRRLRTRLI